MWPIWARHTIMLSQCHALWWRCLRLRGLSKDLSAAGANERLGKHSLKRMSDSSLRTLGLTGGKLSIETHAYLFPRIRIQSPSAKILWSINVVTTHSDIGGRFCSVLLATWASRISKTSPSHQRRRHLFTADRQNMPFINSAIVSKAFSLFKSSVNSSDRGFVIVLEGRDNEATLQRQEDGLQAEAEHRKCCSLSKNWHLPPVVSVRSQISFMTSGPPAAAVHLTVGCKPQRIPPPPPPPTSTPHPHSWWAGLMTNPLLGNPQA